MSIVIPMEDRVTPFMLEDGQVRGRVVRLGAVANTILTRYDYPAPVRQMLGELLVVAAMLSSSLKQEGIFTIQIRGKGLVPLVVVDAVYGGELRGYAEVPPESHAILADMPHATPSIMAGQDAYLAITLDPGAGMQRYQGIVALEGNSVADAFMTYFTQSEQRDVEFQLALAEDKGWRAAGFMIERMPDAEGDAEEHESWRYARAVAATVKNEELLDPLLDAPALLYRLFHEQGVWVYPAHTSSVGCRCSRQRMVDLLTSMSLDDRAEMVVDGVISVHCQFCNKTEMFSPANVGLSVN